jgi:Uma2 family endonuclease
MMSSIVKPTRPIGRLWPPVDSDNPLANGDLPIYRLSVDQYERMLDIGVLTTDDRVELIEGILVRKMTQHPPHAAAIDCVLDALHAVLPKGWRLREQKPIKLSDSEPEPDVVVVRGPLSRYFKRHPVPADIASVIEVADTSLDIDRSGKGRACARARIPIYWIVNLNEQQLEIYTEPKSGKAAGYRRRADYGIGKNVFLNLQGCDTAEIPVRALFPIVEQEAVS